jgi:hypothetical protein
MSWVITGSQKVNWTPANIASDLEFWFDASDTNTLYDSTSGGALVANNGAVARWEDKSGKGRNVTQSNSGDRPTYLTNSINSLPSVSFNNSVLSLAASTVSQRQGQEMICVIDTTDLGTSYRIILSRNSSAPAFYLGSGANYTPAIFWGNDLRWSAAVQRTAIFRFALPSAAVGRRGISVDGGELIQNTVTSNLIRENVDYWTSINTTGGQAATCKVGEMIMTRGDYGPIVEGYLAHKWGLTTSLPSNHPYKANPPAP